MASLVSFLRPGLAFQRSTALKAFATSRFSTLTPLRAEIIDTPSAGTDGSAAAPPQSSQQQQQKPQVASSKQTPPQEPVNPFFAPLQAWLRDFKSNEPKDLIHLQRKVFGAPLRKDILHRVVVWQRDAMRQGTHSTKGRSEVSGTTRKAAPQKGRGAARVGSLRAPQRRGGGVPFGPKPRDHSSELPRKVQEMGLRVALSTKFAQDQLVIVDGIELDSHKTREFEAIKDRHGWDSVLVVASRENENLWRATKNLQQVDVTIMQETDVLRLLKYQMVVMDRKSVRYLEKKLKV
ncbi:ribosomal protein L4/L1 family-domain-containing protein [Mortierella sp. GBAus27b]|nr:54S ribosomal protein L4 mitochondrial [Mortierella sp. GBA43]KAI8353132.1 ribosomal protein L4/L1 family-domain-containing protein [Mortierella sp. GBAus27b]